MDEVGGALIAIALVLCAVFVPTAFITGITGQFYKQFALTIAASTVISAFVSLTLSPGPGGAAAEAARAAHVEKPKPACDDRLADQLVLPLVQPRASTAVALLWRPDPRADPDGRRSCWSSMPA